MDIETTSHILLALVLGTSFGVSMEPVNLQKQLHVLGELIEGKKQPPQKGPNIKPNIFLAAFIGTIGMGILSLMAYFAISSIGIESKTALVAGIVTLVIAKTINSMQIDRVHATISSLKDRFRA